MTLQKITLEDNLLIVSWNDGFESCFHSIWLRDNCHCAQCGNATIGRRILRTSEIELNVFIDSATLNSTSDLLQLAWSDQHIGHFSSQWLRRNCYDETSRQNRAFKPTLWTNEFRRNPPGFIFREVLDDPVVFLELLHCIRDHGLALISDSPVEANTIELLANKIGAIQESNFGRVQDLIVNKEKRSIANDVSSLKPHTDEPYRASPPGLLMFHCIETDVSGAGSSIFLDGFEAAETLRKEDPCAFAALTRNNQGFRRHFENDVDLITEFPVISVDEFGNIRGVRINDRVAAPNCINSDDVPLFYRGMKRLLALSEDSDRTIFHTLKPGDIALFDNHRILHGRTELSFSGRRWLQWVQIERGDFYSAMRITADKLGLDRSDLPLLRGAFG